MSMLHFYRTVGSRKTKFADGVGTISKTAPFTVAIDTGGVKQGTVYEITQGTQPSGDLYNCTTGASKGATATFQRASRLDLALSRQDEEFLGASLALSAALDASEKTVNIQIATQDLGLLKSSNYKLCFAKKVAEGDYNVVWQSYVGYLSDNYFSWSPQYQLFGSNIFRESVMVRAATNTVNIGLGQQSTLDENGVLGRPQTGGPDTGITLINQYGSIHPGINQLSTGIDGNVISTPIYVAPSPIVTGTAVLTPIETVLVWFEQNIETSTMFSTARSNSVEIDLTFSNSETRLYSGQTWTTP